MGRDFERTWKSSDGAPIFYRLWRADEGAPVLVLLHGMASNSTRWNEFVRETRLAQCWNLLRIDRRGQGRSVWRGATGMAEWCADIAGILGAEGFERAVVGGHCLGANVAIEFAARHPALAAGLVLVEPMPAQALVGTLAKVARGRGALSFLLAIVTTLNSIGLHRRKLEDLDLEALDRRSRAKIAAGVSSESALAVYASPFFDLATTPTVSYLRDLLAVTEPLPDLAAIAIPALVLVSTESTMTDPKRARQVMAALPRAEVVEIHARHWIPTEQPAAMRSALDATMAAWLPTFSGNSRSSSTSSSAPASTSTSG